MEKKKQDKLKTRKLVTDKSTSKLIYIFIIKKYSYSYLN